MCDTLTVEILEDYNSYFEQHPPLHIMVQMLLAAFTSYEVPKPPSDEEPITDFETFASGLTGVQRVTQKMPSIWPTEA